MSTGQFHKLLSPLSLGSGLTLKNRMIKAPQSSWFFEDDGSAGDRVIDFYEAIAAGGVGLVIVSAITWRSDHPAGAYGALHDDRFLPGMKRLVERCHAHGCPVFCQLHHSGASAMTGHGGGLPIGPSDLGPDEIPCPPPVGSPREASPPKKSRRTRNSISRPPNAPKPPGLTASKSTARTATIWKAS